MQRVIQAKFTFLKYQVDFSTTGSSGETSSIGNIHLEILTGEGFHQNLRLGFKLSQDGSEGREELELFGVHDLPVSVSHIRLLEEAKVFLNPGGIPPTREGPYTFTLPVLHT